MPRTQYLAWQLCTSRLIRRSGSGFAQLLIVDVALVTTNKDVVAVRAAMLPLCLAVADSIAPWHIRSYVCVQVSEAPISGRTEFKHGGALQGIAPPACSGPGWFSELCANMCRNRDHAERLAGRCAVCKL